MARASRSNAGQVPGWRRTMRSMRSRSYASIAGQLAGEADERPAAGLARISHLAVHAYGPAQRGRVAAFGLQRRVHAGQPLAQPLVE